MRVTSQPWPAVLITIHAVLSLGSRSVRRVSLVSLVRGSIFFFWVCSFLPPSPILRPSIHSIPCADTDGSCAQSQAQVPEHLSPRSPRGGRVAEFSAWDGCKVTGSPSQESSLFRLSPPTHRVPNERLTTLPYRRHRHTPNLALGHASDDRACVGAESGCCAELEQGHPGRRQEAQARRDRD